MPKLVSRMMHSLLLRLIFMLATLGAVVVAALLVSWFVFETIEKNMTSLTAERMPELRSSADVVASMDRTRNLLTATLTATSQTDLQEQSNAADEVFDGFREAIDQLPNGERNAMMPMLDEAQAAVAKLLSAREQELGQNAAMRDTLATASDNASTASSLVEEANDNAFFDMTLSGEETIAVIDETLTRLVDEDFSQFQAALSIRSDINLITGLAIAYGQGQNSQINTIIADLATSSMDRLDTLISENTDTASLQDVLPPLKDAIETYRKVFTSRFRAPDTSEIMAARLSVDTVLSSALDDINFNLFIGSDEAKETNKETLTRLLSQEVEGMRLNASLDAATKQFFVLLLQVAVAQSQTDLVVKQQELVAHAEALRRLKVGSIFDGQTNMEALLALSASDDGIAAVKITAFDAHTKALIASQEATLAVDAIAQATSRFSSSALSKISQAAETLNENVSEAKTQLSQISYAALFILLMSPMLTWVFVTRPIGRVTKVTERLASGDLSEITGLSENPGELGRMASALGVFRASALKSIEMQEAERQRERAAMEEEKCAEREKLNEERRLAAEKAERENMERARAEEHAAEEAARRRKEEAERLERMREQAFIVSSLAEGLKGLAAGDLTCRIDKRFPESYDALRHDFNSAIEKLADIIDQLKDSSYTIEGSCSELASASDDLARRTEVNATTLEETAATIGKLSTSVTESANGASKASKTIQNVREKANMNNEVMKQASAAMTRVEDSSSKITSIVGLIESIAFQTNLLALNAGVEAARAGDAGQGFAVVANEVRVLARRCSEAANDISEVVEESASTVQNGVALTKEADKAMDMINHDIDQISNIVEGIAQSAGRQAEGLKGVNEAIQQLDRSTQSNAGMFEETKASTRLLSSEASALSGVVASFKLGNPAEVERHEKIKEAS